MTKHQNLRQQTRCHECGATPTKWEKKRQLPQIGQTYECENCGYEVHVYETGDAKGHNRTQKFEPVTASMATNLLFFDEVGDWPDAVLETLYKQGLERAEAIDYHIVEVEGLSQSEWAEKTERTQPSVSENVSKARQKFSDE